MNRILVLALILTGCAASRNHWTDVSRGVSVVIGDKTK